MKQYVSARHPTLGSSLRRCLRDTRVYLVSGGRNLASICMQYTAERLGLYKHLDKLSVQIIAFSLVSTQYLIPHTPKFQLNSLNSASISIAVLHIRYLKRIW